MHINGVARQQKGKKYIILGIVLLVLGGISFYAKYKIKAINIPAKETIVENTTGGTSNVIDPFISKLTIPDGYGLNIFARDITGARVIEFDTKGRLLVSQTSEGKISVIEDTDSNGISDTTKILLKGLDSPHGLALKCEGSEPCLLYVAEKDALTQYTYNIEKASVSEYKKLVELPSSKIDRHETRTLRFLPNSNNNILLVSIGSSCDVCEETSDRGKIMAYDLSTKTFTEYAKGLRNSVFMAVNTTTNKVFATEMGRDGLGDDIPPDEINDIEKGKHYGWPICYGKNIHDTNFDKRTYIQNPCMEPSMASSKVDLQAHSAPLGLSFVPADNTNGWPNEIEGDLLVAYHGSWNRKEPTGYKIVKIAFDEKGNFSNMQDFITGWLTTDGKKIGRPVDIKLLPGGVGYISDDSAGFIYKLYVI